MKTQHFRKLVLLFIGLVVCTACVEDDEFDTPDTAIVDPDINPNDILPISSILGDYYQAVADGDNFVTYDNFDDNVIRYVEGYVVSNDEAGNFFEELVIQDKAENPTVGIRFLIDVNPLFVRYDVGRKVYIKLNGLTAAFANGVFSLGVLEGGNQLDKVSSAIEDETILRSSEVATIIPLELSISDFSDDKTNLFVRLNNVQFNRNQAGVLSYASEPSDEFDGERTLESCSETSTVICSTSTFSDFKGLTLPVGSGSVTGILTKDFFGETFNVVINTPEDVDLVGERCDPDFLECTSSGDGGSTIIFSEDFEGFGTFDSEGWTNVNINGGDTEWGEGIFSGNSYAQISGFSSNEDPIETWLVTPAINLDATTNEALELDIQTSFNNGNILSIWVSADFSGDPTSATWQLIDVIIPSGSASGFGSFESLEPINISCLDGDIHIGFFYQGADPGPTTRYHIDNIEVSGS